METLTANPVGSHINQRHSHHHHHAQSNNYGGIYKAHPANCGCADCAQRVTVSNCQRPCKRSSCCSWGCCAILGCVLFTLLLLAILGWLGYLTTVTVIGGSDCKCCDLHTILFEDNFEDDVCFNRQCDEYSHKPMCEKKKYSDWCYTDSAPYAGCGRHYKHEHGAPVPKCRPDKYKGGHGCRKKEDDYKKTSNHQHYGDSSSSHGEEEQEQDCNYFLFPLSKHECAADGDVTVDAEHNLCVDSRPFTQTIPAHGDGSTADGILDRFKFVAYSETAFQLPDEDSCEELVYAVNATCNVRKAGKHPFEQRFVPTPFEDPRLGSCAISTLSLPDHNYYKAGNGSWLEAGFLLTDRSIYASYQMLPFGKKDFGGNMKDYYAFSQLERVGFREEWDYHNLKVAYNPSLKIIRWLINHVEVFRVHQVGFPLDRCHRTADHGGCPKSVFPTSINVGFGTMDFLDWHHFSNGSCTPNPGLVRLSSEPDHHRNPFVLSPSGNPTSPDDFTDEASLRSNRLWGQGALLKMEWLHVGLQRCNCLS